MTFQRSAHRSITKLAPKNEAEKIEPRKMRHTRIAGDPVSEATPA